METEALWKSATTVVTLVWTGFPPKNMTKISIFFGPCTSHFSHQFWFFGARVWLTTTRHSPEIVHHSAQTVGFDRLG